jgi:hypothetical protein
MTLVIALQNSDYVIQFSDRRLSGRDRPADDEADKAAVLITSDTRMVMGFTGIAEQRQQAARKTCLFALPSP